MNPANHNKPWTSQDIEMLKYLVDKKRCAAYCAHVLNRSELGTLYRIFSLGLDAKYMGLETTCNIAKEICALHERKLSVKDIAMHLPTISEATIIKVLLAHGYSGKPKPKITLDCERVRPSCTCGIDVTDKGFETFRDGITINYRECEDRLSSYMCQNVEEFVKNLTEHAEKLREAKLKAKIAHKNKLSIQLVSLKTKRDDIQEIYERSVRFSLKYGDSLNSGLLLKELSAVNTIIAEKQIEFHDM